MRGVWSSSRWIARWVRAKVTASSTSPTRAMKTTSAATNGWPITSAARHACARRDVGPDPPVGQRLDRPVDDPDPAQDRRDQRQRDPPAPASAPSPAPKTTSPPIRRPSTIVEDVERAMVVVVPGAVSALLEGVRVQVVHVGGVVLAMQGGILDPEAEAGPDQAGFEHRRAWHRR